MLAKHNLSKQMLLKRAFVYRINELSCKMDNPAGDFCLTVKEGDNDDDYICYNVRRKYYEKFVNSNSCILSFYDLIYCEKLQKYRSKFVRVKLENVARIGYFYGRYPKAIQTNLKFVDF